MSRRRILSDGELTLWRTAMASTEVKSKATPATAPKQVGAARAAPPQTTMTDDALLADWSRAGAPASRNTMKPSAEWLGPKAHFHPAPSPIDRLSMRTPGLDRKTAKALSKGEKRPQARLDLHGMTLDRAYGALQSFIQSAQARELRLVLVITGKGGDYRARASGAFDLDAATGALRRNVPRWLREAPLAGEVTGVFPAHPRYGGEGALFVYLKKRR